MGKSPFADYEDEAWPWRFDVTLHLYSIAGGVPSDPDVAEAWIRKNVVGASESRIQELVATTMAERGVTEQEAIEQVNRLKHLNGFKRGQDGLYIEGRQVKAAIREAASIAAASGKLALTKWGWTGKYIQSWVAEHIMVDDDVIWLGKDEPDEVAQSFPENKRIGQRGIQLTEVVRDANVTFRVKTDWGFTKREWGMIFLTGGEEGLGSCRSQGYGRYMLPEDGFVVRGRALPDDSKGNTVAPKKPAADKPAKADAKA